MLNQDTAIQITFTVDDIRALEEKYGKDIEDAEDLYEAIFIVLGI